MFWMQGQCFARGKRKASREKAKGTLVSVRSDALCGVGRCDLVTFIATALLVQQIFTSIVTSTIE